MKKLKAFFDVGEEETMTYQRWGATTFVRGQLQVACGSKYAPDAEPDHSMQPGDLLENADLETFLAPLRAAFPVRRPELDVIVKRTSFIATSTLRSPATISRTALAMSAALNYLTPEAGNAWQNFRENDVMPPAAVLRHEIDIEQGFLERILNPHPRWVHGTLARGGALADGAA